MRTGAEASFQWSSSVRFSSPPQVKIRLHDDIRLDILIDP